MMFSFHVLAQAPITSFQRKLAIDLTQNPHTQAVWLKYQQTHSVRETVSAFYRFQPKVLIYELCSLSDAGFEEIEALDHLKKISPKTQLIIIGEQFQEKDLIEAANRFQVDLFLRKSEHFERELREICMRALLSQMHEENHLVPEKDQILGKSEIQRRALFQIDQAVLSQNILISGETGTGKELLAKRAHMNAQFLLGQEDRPLQILDCSSIPKELFESEVFGHVKGAFSHAIRDRKGAVEGAHGGDLFLDEIHNIPIPIQRKLLRVLNDGVFRRVGETKERHSQFRIIAATNQDLEMAKKEGRILPDFLARIDGVRVFIPPLRERPEDILSIAKKVIQTESLSQKELTEEAAEFLKHQKWEENVRELKVVISAAVSATKTPFITKDVIKEVLDQRTKTVGESVVSIEGDPGSMISRLVDGFIENRIKLSQAVNWLESDYIQKLQRRHLSLREISQVSGYSRTKIKPRILESVC